MAVRNDEIAEDFEKVADLLDIEGANPFRIRAYRNAARTVRSHPKSMGDLLRHGEDLSRLPDIGNDLAKKIETIVRTGELPLLRQIETRTPATLRDILKIQGLGPRRVQALYQHLDVRNLEDLRRAARAGRIHALSGFGEKTERMILERVEHPRDADKRLPFAAAEEIAGPLLTYLRNTPGVRTVVVAGSFRRRKETVGDLDVLVTGAPSAAVMARLREYDETREIIYDGQTRSTVRLRSGLTVDVRFVPPVSFGAALVYFTGSKEHNIAIRTIAAKKNLKINEYGVFRGKRRIAGGSEKSVYAAIGLPVIAPELRENRGEIEAAKRHRLPKLIEEADIRGDLHCHTNATDGRSTIAQIATAAAERGYEYVSINDHSRNLTIARGLDEERLWEQIRSIDALNARSPGVTVLKSIEVDILQDGSLDLPDSVLRELDFTVCAIHSQHNLPRKKQTERILRAMESRYCNILAHPTGRLLSGRQPYRIDLVRIMRAARDYGCFLELNAHPDRLDLSDKACQLAKELGVRVAISSDAHHLGHLNNMRYGVNQARRGWLEKADVINALPIGELRKAFHRD